MDCLLAYEKSNSPTACPRNIQFGLHNSVGLCGFLWLFPKVSRIISWNKQCLICFLIAFLL
jgi:hypothetical protein